MATNPERPELMSRNVAEWTADPPEKRRRSLPPGQPSKRSCQCRCEETPERDQPGRAPGRVKRTVHKLEHPHSGKSAIQQRSEQADCEHDSNGGRRISREPDIHADQADNQKRADPDIAAAGAKHSDPPPDLKECRIGERTAHPASGSWRHPDLANSKCAVEMERSRNPPSQ